jgi:hypothetical protein
MVSGLRLVVCHRVIDYHNFDRAFLRIESEPELLPHRSEDRRTRIVVRWRTRWRVERPVPE